LVVLVLVIGAGLGFLVRTGHLQREAVAAVRQEGGWVAYDWIGTNGKVIPQSESQVPSWLADLVAADYFGDVTDVGLASSSKATDAVIPHLARLTRLRHLILSETHFSLCHA
jgi:hypothetical protein